MQLEQYVSAEEIFTEYAYFSSYSDSWVEHAQQLRGRHASRFGLDGDSLVVELASNDGYLLQYFVERGHPRPRDRARRQRGRGGRDAAASRRWSSSSADELARELADARAGTPISSSATTCWRRCPT